MIDASATIIIDGPAVAKGRLRMMRRGVAYTRPPPASMKHMAVWQPSSPWMGGRRSARRSS